MNDSTKNFESDGDDDREELEDPRLAALVEALVEGEAIDWQEAESSAGSEEERERIRSLAAISEVATFHRTWLAEAGITGDLDEDEEQDDEVPTQWGELEILERVGRGSFGDVYKAREPRLDRIVALKLIRASAKTPEREAETLREGRLLAKVRHPNVATVHGAAGADGRVGFWMEFLEGKNLAEILAEKGRFEAREAAEVGIALCRALAAVHAQGIVHRDVKAQNVVRENDGRIVLTDFGVGRDTAVLQSEEPSLSGTPLYLAPELFEGKTPSPASDLYALGVLLFYLVTGEFPVTGNTFEELRAAHQGRKRRWLKELRKDLPGTFVAAVERALDRDPEKRPQDAADFEMRLTEFLGESVKVKRYRSVALFAAAIVIVGLAFGWVSRETKMNWRKRILMEVAEPKRKELKTAIGKLESATKSDPAFVEGWQQLGLLRERAGDYDGSRNAYLEAQKLCADDDSLVCLRASTYYDLACLRYEDALPRFEKIVAIDPVDVDSLRQIGMIDINLAQPDLGIGRARQAGVAEPENPVAVGLLPFVLAAASEPEALEVVAKAKKKLPAVYYYWPEGIAEMTFGNPEAALKAFEAMKTDPVLASTGEILKAQVLLERGEPSDAKATLESGLSVDGNNSLRNGELRRVLLAETALLRNDFDAVDQNLRALLAPPKEGGIAVIPANLRLLRSAFIVAHRAENRDLARRFSEKINSLAASREFDSQTSRAIRLQVAGEMSAAEGDFDAAMRSFDQAIGIRNDPFLQASRLRLFVAQGKCADATSQAKLVRQKPGLIYSDYFVPWIEIRDALDLVEKHCTPK